MSKFRESAYDAPPRIKIKPDAKPGALPVNRTPVIVNGQRVGHVSARTGSAATALRLGAKNARLGKHEGKPAWIGISGRGSIKGDKLDAQLRMAKGSVTKNPSPPETTARPKR